MLICAVEFLWRFSVLPVVSLIARKYITAIFAYTIFNHWLEQFYNNLHSITSCVALTIASDAAIRLACSQGCVQLDGHSKAGGVHPNQRYRLETFDELVFCSDLWHSLCTVIAALGLFKPARVQYTGALADH